eukprot:1837115-Lingulodinium_polyedra.AAC.1
MAHPSMATSAFSVVGGGLPGSSLGVPAFTPECASPVGTPVARPPQIHYSLWAKDAVWQDHVAHFRGMPG